MIQLLQGGIYKMKKIIYLVLVISLIFSLIPQLSFAADDSTNVLTLSPNNIMVNPSSLTDITITASVTENVYVSSIFCGCANMYGQEFSTLIPDTDYKASGNNITISKSYLTSYFHNPYNQDLILNFFFSNGSASFITIHRELIGDLNGDGKINSLDYSLMKQYLLNHIDTFPVKDILFVADLEGDGVISSKDLSLIKRYILETINVFPKEVPIPTTITISNEKQSGFDFFATVKLTDSTGFPLANQKISCLGMQGKTGSNGEVYFYVNLFNKFNVFPQYIDVQASFDGYGKYLKSSAENRFFLGSF